jgi:RHH-type rel operon transcriptional repressor/antitoxin RelB
MSKQTAVRLPDELHGRLQALAERTGRNVTYYVREAVEQQLDELEDIYLGEEVAQRVRRGDEEVLSAEAFWRDMDD